MIKNKILKSEPIKWRETEWFQPEGLKKTTPALINKLKLSLKKNGFASPFYIWQKNGKNFIIDGCYRKKALDELDSEGVEIPDELPANYLNIKNKKEAKKLVLAFNSHYAELDKKATFEFISDLDFNEIKLEFEPFKLGFSYPQLDAIEDEPPPIPQETISKLGDLYELGNHRILCGDSTDSEQVGRLMDGVKADSS